MNTKYWVGFSAIEEIDSKFIEILYNHFGDIKIAFEANESELSAIDGITKNKINEFLTHREKIDLDEKYNAVLERGIKVLTYEDKHYPYMLKNIDNPPMVIYYKGDISSCNLERTLAIVGSRRMSLNAKESLKKIMKGFIGTDLCVVSGLAAGVDTAAHRFALDNDLKTIGVIAGGLDFVYPASNKGLYEEIINGKGAVISEYYPTFEPLKFRFPQRNRIVTGLSYGTLVVEAALKSGALISANLTLEQGRELMCVPGLITNPNTEGIYKLIKTGASLITESDDVLNALNWVAGKQQTLFDTNEKKEIIENDDNLTFDEKKILYTIDIEPKSFDEIQKLTKMKTDELLMNLTTLELKGNIEQTLGDRYKVR
ncbi:MAG: DNA-processing protein DprA [Candidatus Gastranaerophilales bacterium]|nr:DNA-processing protein DprA [Candidatus Gastranaerophilales bacterium]